MRTGGGRMTQDQKDAPESPTEARTDDGAEITFRDPADAESFRRALETGHDAIREPGYGASYKGITITVYQAMARSEFSRNSINFGIALALPQPPDALTARDAMILAGQLVGVAERMKGMEAAENLRQEIEREKMLANQQAKMSHGFVTGSTQTSVGITNFGQGNPGVQSQFQQAISNHQLLTAQQNAIRNTSPYQIPTPSGFASGGFGGVGTVNGVSPTSGSSQGLIKTVGQLLGVVK